ncbi:MAG TPA: RNA polymerase sigma factor [Puia sp.]|nr:RNA polymerase sigma factor [Puia sp.]
MTIETFNQEFESNLGALRSYLLRITASVRDAEDLAQDTYIRAAGKLDGFRGESSLRTWIFTIASNLAKDNLRVRKRWTENITDITRAAALSDQQFFQEAMQIRMISPQGQYEAREHIAFCFTCISKSLPLEQQLCIFLKEVYEFRVAEIATILGATEAMVKYYLHAGRSKMIGIFDGRCALINKEGVCHQCSELNGIFNPQQNTQEELMKIDLVREAEKGGKEHLFDLRMQILREIDPFTSKAAELQLHHLEHNRQVMEKYSQEEAG